MAKPVIIVGAGVVGSLLGKFLKQKQQRKEQEQTLKNHQDITIEAVSNTHLTLPTKRID